jgi:uncharacterized membrane protein
MSVAVMSHIYKEIKYTKTMMLTGFLKSTLGTGLISLGIMITFMSIAQPTSYHPYSPVLGILVVILGCIVYFLGDVYKMIQKKKELNIIESRTLEIVKHVYQEANAERDQKVEEKLKEFEDAICTNSDSLCGKK